MKARSYKLALALILILPVLTACMQNETAGTDSANDGMVIGSSAAQDAQAEILNGVLIQRGKDGLRTGLKNDASDILGSYGAVKDIEDLLWISSRGGAGIEAGGTMENISDLPAVDESENALTDHQTDWYSREVDSEAVWIRLIFEPYKPAQGENAAAHKDVIVYLDPDDKSNAFLGIQDPDDENQWTMISLPGYGSWLEREVDMTFRLIAGL